MERLSPPQIRDIIKIDLHRHLDCSVRWSTLVELSKNDSSSFQKSHRDLRNEFLILEPMTDLGSVLRKFTHTQKIFKSEDILERIAFEACEDAFNDGIRLLELRYAPSFIQEGNPFLSFEKIHLALVKGIKKAEKNWPITVGLICIIQRTKSLKTAEDVCSFAIEHKDTFWGLDLADDESKADPKQFAKIFQKAKTTGLKITVHSGETPDDKSAQWVKDSIEILGADRIGHGVQIIRDPQILKYVVEQKIPLEICPISNYLTQGFKTYAEHPLRKLKDAGVLVTLNSDDPGIFATTLSDEYQIAQDYHNFSLQDFKDCNQISLEYSFAKTEIKEKIRTEFT